MHSIEYTTHVYPDNDLFEHVIKGRDCHCKPRYEQVEIIDDEGEEREATMVIHRSYDGREHSEPDHQRNKCEQCIEEEISSHLQKYQNMTEKELEEADREFRETPYSI